MKERLQLTFIDLRKHALNVDGILPFTAYTIQATNISATFTNQSARNKRSQQEWQPK